MSPWLRVLAGGWGTIGAAHLTLGAKVGQICKRSGSKPVSPELANLPLASGNKRDVFSPLMKERRGCCLPMLSQRMRHFKKTRGPDLCPWYLSCGGPGVRLTHENTEGHRPTGAALPQQLNEETDRLHLEVRQAKGMEPPADSVHL